MRTNHNGNYDGHDVVDKNTDFFVTQTIIKQDVRITDLIELLKVRKTTGDLCVRFNRGGIRQIEVKEWTKPSSEAADQIREILKME